MSIKLADQLASSRDSSMAMQYASTLKAASSSGYVRGASTPRDERPWAAADLAVMAFSIGVRSSVEIVLDSAVRLNETEHTLYSTYNCIGEHQSVRVGVYVVAAKFQDSRWTFESVVFRLLGSRVPKVVQQNLHVYCGSCADLTDVAISADLQFLRSSASRLRVLVPDRVDVLAISARDSMLSSIGIVEWADAIDEMTSVLGPLIVSKVQPQGGLSRHEMIHALLVGIPLHPLLQEGFAVYLGGVRGMSLTEAVCRRRGDRDRWSASQLNALLHGAADADFGDVELAVLGGVLASMFVDEPQRLWTIHISTSTEASEVVRKWEHAIDEVVGLCSVDSRP